MTEEHSGGDGIRTSNVRPPRSRYLVMQGRVQIKQVLVDQLEGDVGEQRLPKGGSLKDGLRRHRLAGRGRTLAEGADEVHHSIVKDRHGATGDPRAFEQVFNL